MVKDNPEVKRRKSVIGAGGKWRKKRKKGVKKIRCADFFNVFCGNFQTSMVNVNQMWAPNSIYLLWKVLKCKSIQIKSQKKRWWGLEEETQKLKKIDISFHSSGWWIEFLLVTSTFADAYLMSCRGEAVGVGKGGESCLAQEGTCCDVHNALNQVQKYENFFSSFSYTFCFFMSDRHTNSWQLLNSHLYHW